MRRASAVSAAPPRPRSAPGIERVVDRQGQLELSVIAGFEQENLGDRLQPGRLWRRLEVLLDVGAVEMRASRLSAVSSIPYSSTSTSKEQSPSRWV